MTTEDFMLIVLLVSSLTDTVTWLLMRQRHREHMAHLKREEAKAERRRQLYILQEQRGRYEMLNMYNDFVLTLLTSEFGKEEITETIKGWRDTYDQEIALLNAKTLMV